MFENHQRHADARKHIEDWLSAGPEHMKQHEILGREAVGKDLGITETGTYPEWREKADRLIVAGEAILSDAKTYGAHLDNLPIGNTPVEEELLRLQRAIRDDDNSAAKRKAREQRSEPVDRQDEAAKPVGTDTAPARPDVRTLYEAVQRDWNRLAERAREAGVPTFDLEGSEPLIERMRSLMENPELPARTRHVFAGAIQEYRQGELALEGSHVEEPGGAETVARDVAAAPSPDHDATPVESAVTPDAAVAPPAGEDRAPSQVQEPAPPAAEPVWLPAYEALVQDWNALAASARQSGTLSFYSRGLRRPHIEPQGARGKPGHPGRDPDADDQGTRKSRAQSLDTKEGRGLALRRRTAQGQARRTRSRGRQSRHAGLRGAGVPGLETGSRAPDDCGRGHPLRHRDLRRPSRQHHARRAAHGLGALAASRGGPGGRRGTRPTQGPRATRTSPVFGRSQFRGGRRR